MAILKLSRLAYLIVLLLSFSCQKTIVKTYDNDDCDVYVAGKKGFWIDIYSKSLKENEIEFKFEGKLVIPQNKEIATAHISYFINENLKLQDTLTIAYKGKIYRIYNFKNLKETAIDGSNHKNVEICRVSTAKINGEVIQDSRNNILKVDFD